MHHSQVINSIFFYTYVSLIDGGSETNIRHGTWVEDLLELREDKIDFMTITNTLHIPAHLVLFMITHLC